MMWTKQLVLSKVKLGNRIEIMNLYSQSVEGILIDVDDYTISVHSSYDDNDAVSHILLEDLTIILDLDNNKQIIFEDSYDNNEKN